MLKCLGNCRFQSIVTGQAMPSNHAMGWSISHTKKNKMFMKTTFISKKKAWGKTWQHVLLTRKRERERDSFSFLCTHHTCQQGSLKKLAIAIGSLCSSCHAQTLMQIPYLRMLTFTAPNQGPATRNLPSILHGRVTFLKAVILHRELPFNCH